MLFGRKSYKECPTSVWIRCWAKRSLKPSVCSVCDNWQLTSNWVVRRCICQVWNEEAIWIGHSTSSFEGPSSVVAFCDTVAWLAWDSALRNLNALATAFESMIISNLVQPWYRSLHVPLYSPVARDVATISIRSHVYWSRLLWLRASFHVTLSLAKTIDIIKTTIDKITYILLL